MVCVVMCYNPSSSSGRCKLPLPSGGTKSAGGHKQTGVGSRAWLAGEPQVLCGSFTIPAATAAGAKCPCQDAKHSLHTGTKRQQGNTYACDCCQRHCQPCSK
jgi:hypothetical protein